MQAIQGIQECLWVSGGDSSFLATILLVGGKEWSDGLYTKHMNSPFMELLMAMGLHPLSLTLKSQKVSGISQSSGLKPSL